MDALRGVYELQESIENKEEADAAAEAVAEGMALLRDCSIAVQYVPAETIMPQLEAAGMTDARMEAIYTSLVDNRFMVLRRCRLQWECRPRLLKR